MRLRHIEVFDAVYTSGSVTRAGELLNVSQPSVSKVLAHAEQQLGFPLFERVKGRLVPTPEADRLHAHVKRVNRHLVRLRHVASNIADVEEGHLRIASTPAFGVRFIPEVIARWLEVSPGTRFTVETRHLHEIVDGLKNLRLDLGISFEPQEISGVGHSRLARGRFMVIAPVSMDLGNRKRLTLEDLAAYPFIALDSQGPLGVQLREAFEGTSTQPNVVAKVETYHLARALAAEGVGVTIADEVTARSHGGPPVQVVPLEPALHFHFAALHNVDMPASQLQHRFSHFLKEQLLDFLEQD